MCGDSIACTVASERSGCTCRPTEQLEKVSRRPVLQLLPTGRTVRAAVAHGRSGAGHTVNLQGMGRSIIPFLC